MTEASDTPEGYVPEVGDQVLVAGRVSGVDEKNRWAWVSWPDGRGWSQIPWVGMIPDTTKDAPPVQ